MNKTAHRDSVSHKSFRSSKELIDYCKPIDQGWFRCQALAIGAAKLDRDHCEIACRAAVKAAKSESDQYRRITPLAWPIGALAHSGHEQKAAKLFDEAIKGSRSITPGNSRAECLEVLFRRTEPLSINHRKKVFPEIVDLANNDQGAWRITRNGASVAELLDHIGERAFVDKALKRCTHEKLIARINRDRAKSGES